MTREINERIDLLVPYCLDAEGLECFRQDIRLGCKLSVNAFDRARERSIQALLAAPPPPGASGGSRGVDDLPYWRFPVLGENRTVDIDGVLVSYEGCHVKGGAPSLVGAARHLTWNVARATVRLAYRSASSPRRARARSTRSR